MSDPQEDPIGDDEVIYRRIPVSMDWYNPAVSPDPSPKSYSPRPDDVTGVSVSRKKYKTAAQAAQGLSAKGYYIAPHKVGVLRAAGIDVVPRPTPDDPGHAELPDLAYGNKDTDQARDFMGQLATNLRLGVVEGPFPPPPPAAPAEGRART